MNPVLSILVCSVGDRLWRMAGLYGNLAEQAAPFHPAVEVLALTDNRCRSIGMKRQALLDVAAGDYVCYVDDDDDVVDDYVATLHGAITKSGVVDVFTFPTLCVSEEHGTMTVHHSVNFPNEAPASPSFRRKPWFVHPIRRELAQSSRFTDKSWGEDADWLAPLWEKMANEEIVTARELYTYRWDDGKKG